MPYTEFYMQTTGSNLNAGSTNTDAATSTTTNGNWDSATGIFIAASGTPFAATQVGDWASIYLDAATTAVFIAQVTAVTSSTQITVSLTVKFGTAPTTGATGRSCRIGGAHANLLGIGTAMASGTTPIALRINVRAGTYAHTTSAIGVGLVGTTLLPVWIRGYRATPGDLDGDPTTNRVEGTDMPLMTFTTGGFTFSGSTHNILTLIAFTSARATGSPTVTVAGTARRCRFYQTGTIAGASAIGCSSLGTRLYNCRAEATTSNTAVISGLSSGSLDSCVLVGGINSLNTGSTSAGSIRNCVFRGYTTTGYAVPTGNPVRVANCTFVGGVNGISFTGTIGASEITNCMFSGCSTAGINNTSGTNTNLITRADNAFWNCGAQEIGFGDSPAFNSITETADPLTGSTDLSLKATALSKGAAGGLFEGESYTNYLDVGAVQRQEASGAFGQLNMRGGFVNG